MEPDGGALEAWKCYFAATKQTRSRKKTGDDILRRVLKNRCASIDAVTYEDVIECLSCL